MIKSKMYQIVARIFKNEINKQIAKERAIFEENYRTKHGTHIEPRILVTSKSNIQVAFKTGEKPFEPPIYLMADDMVEIKPETDGADSSTVHFSVWAK